MSLVWPLQGLLIPCLFSNTKLFSKIAWLPWELFPSKTVSFVCVRTHVFGGAKCTCKSWCSGLTLASSWRYKKHVNTWEFSTLGLWRQLWFMKYPGLTKLQTKNFCYLPSSRCWPDLCSWHGFREQGLRGRETGKCHQTLFLFVTSNGERTYALSGTGFVQRK